MREKRGRLRAGALTLLFIVAGSAGTATAVTDESATSKAPAATAPAEHAEGQVGPSPEVVEVEPVPEPSTGLLLCAAGVVTLVRRRKRAARRSD